MNLFGAVMLVILFVGNLSALVSLLFVRKGETSVTLAWLMVFVFVPVVGFMLYFFLGSTSKFRVLSKKYNLRPESLKKIQAPKPTEPAQYNAAALANLDLVRVNQRNAGCSYTQQNLVELLPSAQVKYERMFREIEEARDTINVLYFIIKTHDQSAKDFIRLLARKAREGVTVRLIYDSFGDITVRRRHFQELIDAGGMVYGYLPSLLRTVLEVNYRMHRKMVVIDGKVAYTGGINIGDDYLGLYPDKSPWRDTSIRVTGPAVHDIQLRFVRDWVYIDLQSRSKNRYKSPIESEENLRRLFPTLEPAGEMGVQIICSGPDCPESYTKDSYQRMISTADRYIYIQTPYFVPDETLLNTLRLAAHAGIDVRVMIPGIPDKKFVYAVTLSYVGDLLRAGIPVYVHKGFLHAKTFVLDDMVASVGTTNFDIRSFDLDFEINAMVFDEDFAISCRDTFIRDMEACKLLTLDEYEKRGVLARLREGFWRLVAPLV